MKKSFILFILPAFLSMKPPVKELHIQGQVKLLKPAEWIYLSYRTGDGAVKDSSKIINGNFRFAANIEEPTLASLWVYSEKIEGQKPKQDIAPIYLEPGKIEVMIVDSMKNMTVKGSKSHSDYLVYKKMMQPLNDKNAELMAKYTEYNKNNDEEGKKRIIEMADVLNDEMTAMNYKFLSAHITSPIALNILKQYAGYDLDAEKIEPLFASLPEEVRSWPSAKSFGAQIELAKKTGIGMYAMDFTQNDTLGNPVSLSSFKGKYVLVDFWASWCRPCRLENPNVVKAYHAFKEKGFTVLGVSLDQPGKHQAWMDAIHKDQLEWTHVSDLKFWENEVARQYGIRAIPQNFLIDREGKIIAKNIRGEELQAKLKELVK